MKKRKLEESAISEEQNKRMDPFEKMENNIYLRPVDWIINRNASMDTLPLPQIESLLSLPDFSSELEIQRILEESPSEVHEAFIQKIAKREPFKEEEISPELQEVILSEMRNITSMLDMNHEEVCFKYSK